MKIYTIIGGVNGVGKSSLSGVLCSTDTNLGYIIDTDKITAENGGNRLKGGKIAVNMINDCLSKGMNFTQESTLSGVKTLKTILKARKQDYYVRLYYVGLSSSEESISRIKNRVQKGGHDISHDDVKRRYSKRFDDLARILPFCNEARLYDNENGFVEVAMYMNNVLYTAKNVPTWVRDFDDFLKNQVNSQYNASAQSVQDKADDYALLMQAQERLENSEEMPSLDETMKLCGISQEELDNTEEPEIE